MKKKETGEKKKINKKWIIGFVVLCLLSSIFVGGEEEKVEEQPVVETVQEEIKEEASPIELIAGQEGEYGKLLKMNDEEFFVYYLPSGKYSVENIGEYMTQVTVYESVAKNEESGLDEYTDSLNPILLDVEEVKEIEIPEGWFIEIQDPTHISLLPIE